jgi:hypothetical protein
VPVHRPDQLPPAEARTRSFGPFNVGDDWGPEPPLSLWRGAKLSVNVERNTVLVRLSRTQPPAPPEWDAPIPVPVGYWSHGGPLGYWQFRNQTAGRVAVVSGAAYAE